ncbi:hypothetical protein AB1Y20_003314 [Prymnesium parvum]|uniref:Uncharacterized protein n=1 Tax=Prymnesium parvum TaxID=97485 RepID=A0AB34JE59_PRYPA
MAAAPSSPPPAWPSANASLSCQDTYVQQDWAIWAPPRHGWADLTEKIGCSWFRDHDVSNLGHLINVQTREWAIGWQDSCAFFDAEPVERCTLYGWPADPATDVCSATTSPFTANLTATTSSSSLSSAAIRSPSPTVASGTPSSASTLSVAPVFATISVTSCSSTAVASFAATTVHSHIHPSSATAKSSSEH